MSVSAIQVVATTYALKNHSNISDRMLFKTMGKDEPYDGGTDDYIYLEGDYTTEDGLTAIRHKNGGGTFRSLNGVTLQKLRATGKDFNVLDFGAKGDSVTDDYSAIQLAINEAGAFGTIRFGVTSVNIFTISQELKFLEGQELIGTGGTSVLGLGTEIKLVAAANGVMSPDTPETMKYAGIVRGIYFNAQGYGDYGLSLYNCSYFDISHCAANSTKANGCGLLLDSNVSLQCYFNIIRGGRYFATGIGGAAIRFTRGANANTVIGGKCGSSYCGMSFLASSAGNIIIGTDFEDNVLCHVYSDSPSNIFQNLHMENCPIGYWLTINATNTTRMATSYASTVTTQVQDYSKTGMVLDTRIDTVSTKGDLRFGPAKFLANYLSGSSNLDYDPDLATGTSGADIRFYLNTNTTGNKRMLMYKGDGTSNIGIILNAKTGDVQHGTYCRKMETEAESIVKQSAAQSLRQRGRGRKGIFAILPHQCLVDMSAQFARQVAPRAYGKITV